MKKAATSLKRLFTAALTLGLMVLGGASWAAVEPEVGFGYPRDISIDGWRIDWLIDVTMLFVVLLFVIMCLWLAYCWFFHDENHPADYDHGQSKHHIITAVLLSSVIFWVVDGNLLVNSIIDVREAFWNFQIPTGQESLSVAGNRLEGIPWQIAGRPLRDQMLFSGH